MKIIEKLFQYGKYWCNSQIIALVKRGPQEQYTTRFFISLCRKTAYLILVTIMEFAVIKPMTLAVNVILAMMGTIVKMILMIACLILVTIMEFVLIKSMTLVVNVTLAMMGIIVKIEQNLVSK